MTIIQQTKQKTKTHITQFFDNSKDFRQYFHLLISIKKMTTLNYNIILNNAANEANVAISLDNAGNYKEAIYQYTSN